MSLGFEVELNDVTVQRCTWPTFMGFYNPLGTPTFSVLEHPDFDKEQLFVENSKLISGFVEWGLARSSGVILELVTAPDLAAKVDVAAGTTKDTLDMLERFMHALGAPGTWYHGSTWSDGLSVTWLKPECAAHVPEPQSNIFLSSGSQRTSSSSAVKNRSTNVQVNFSVNLGYIGKKIRSGIEFLPKSSPFPKELGSTVPSVEKVYVMCGEILKSLAQSGVIGQRTDKVIWGFLWLALHVMLTEAQNSAPFNSEKQRYQFLPRASIHAVAVSLDPLYKKLIGNVWPHVMECVNQNDKLTMDAGTMGFRRDFTRSRMDLRDTSAPGAASRAKLLAHYKNDCVSLFLDTVAHGLGVFPKEQARKLMDTCQWRKSWAELYDITQVCDTKQVAPLSRPNDSSVAVVFEARGLGGIDGTPAQIRQELETLGKVVIPLDPA